MPWARSRLGARRLVPQIPFTKVAGPASPQAYDTTHAATAPTSRHADPRPPAPGFVVDIRKVRRFS